MNRLASSDLLEWLARPSRKPLVIRGARQVGKTWLVRDFAQRSGRRLVEINFERHPDAVDLVDLPDPAAVLRSLEAYRGVRIRPEDTLLFLDEIQVAPQLFSRLRWFAEELPELPVVAAGSLLDFVLADHTFSMPVGRINYLHLEPLTFEEFLGGVGEETLLDGLRGYNLSNLMPAPLHRRLLSLFRDYLLIGGLPAAVETWRTEKSYRACAQIHQDLLATFRDDFGKYAARVPRRRLEQTLAAVPRQLGRKFKFSHVDRDERALHLRRALEQLCLARLCHIVQGSDCTGVPLEAEIRERVFKVMFLDVGLVSASLGLSVRAMGAGGELLLTNEGAVAEQVVGQALRTLGPRFKAPANYYWARERRGSHAELDYVIEHGSTVVPIEVKAGATGSLKSLHLFMALRNLPIAVRFNAELPSWVDVDVKTTTGGRAQYRLLSLPLYLAGWLPRWLDIAAEAVGGEW